MQYTLNPLNRFDTANSAVDSPAVIALLEGHRHLVNVTVRRRFPSASDEDREALEDIGLLALLRAARTHDATRTGKNGKHATFQTYAILLMRQSMGEAAKLKQLPSQRWFGGPCQPGDEKPGAPVSLSVHPTEGSITSTDSGAISVERLEYDAALDPEEETLKRWRQRVLWEAIASLPDADREVLERYYLHGQNLREIAAEWKMTYQGVSKACKRALSRLRDRPEIQRLA
jgi:RNA polymerase sigma factor (sigma-70 family)